MDMTTWPTQKQKPPSACGSRGFSRGVPRTLVSVSPAAYVTLSTGRRKKKEGKNHAADELIKVRLAQVSHKVAGARDGRLFTGWNGRPKEIHKDKRVSGGRRSWTKECCFQVNVQWNLAPLRISGRFHEAVICVYDPSSFWSHVGSVLGSYLLSARWLGTTSRDFNRTCVCLFKSQLQVFPDQLLSYMMIQAN